MQLADQSTSTQFMSIHDSMGPDMKTVLFDNQNVLDSKIGKLTPMVSTLIIQSNNQGNPLNHKLFQRKGRLKKK